MEVRWIFGIALALLVVILAELYQQVSPAGSHCYDVVDAEGFMRRGKYFVVPLHSPHLALKPYSHYPILSSFDGELSERFEVNEKGEFTNLKDKNYFATNMQYTMYGKNIWKIHSDGTIRTTIITGRQKKVHLTAELCLEIEQQASLEGSSLKGSECNGSENQKWLLATRSYPSATCASYSEFWNIVNTLI